MMEEKERKWSCKRCDNFGPLLALWILGGTTEFGSFTSTIAKTPNCVGERQDGAAGEQGVAGHGRAPVHVGGCREWRDPASHRQ